MTTLHFTQHYLAIHESEPSGKVQYWQHIDDPEGPYIRQCHTPSDALPGDITYEIHTELQGKVKYENYFTLIEDPLRAIITFGPPTLHQKLKTLSKEILNKIEEGTDYEYFGGTISDTLSAQINKACAQEQGFVLSLYGASVLTVNQLGLRLSQREQSYLLEESPSILLSVSQPLPQDHYHSTKPIKVYTYDSLTNKA